MFVYDQLDILTFIQTTGGAEVEAFDASVDSIATTGVSTNVLDLEAAEPNYNGQSLYIVPRADADGAGIGGTGDPLVVAKLYSGDAANTVTTEHGAARQVAATDPIEIPLPLGVGRYLKALVLSDGGGAANPISTGAVQVFIAESGKLS